MLKIIVHFLDFEHLENKMNIKGLVLPVAVFIVAVSALLVTARYFDKRPVQAAEGSLITPSAQEKGKQNHLTPERQPEK